MRVTKGRDEVVGDEYLERTDVKNSGGICVCVCVC